MGRGWASAVMLAAALSAPAFGAWQEFKSGPFTVISERGEKQSRDVLAELEQFRGALGQAVGKTELKTVWPVTVVVD
ncbi:MAG TPA: hypothetical protein PKJ41_16060, partial [Bryobacteraceae bacterium]|nr:hypothetical protein [Bryobacteraceae bacterium]